MLQSATIPYQINHIYHSTIYQWNFFIGTKPNAIILCVNPQDDLDYIIRTVKFLKSAIETKVIALSLFPIELAKQWSGFGFQNRKLAKQEYYDCAN